MPRMARVVVPHYPYHLTQRGNRRQPVFLAQGDEAAYLSLLRAACANAGTRVLAYCLMPNHVHFVMVPTHEDGLRAAVADAHRRYTRRVNFREGWRGHLWQDRFHSFVMDEAHLRMAVAYVEHNPVRAGLCEAACDWPWSSASECATDGDDGLVDWDLREQLLGLSQPLAAANATEDPEAIRLHTRTGRPLGTEGFVERIEAAVGRRLRPKKRGPKPRE